AGMYCGSCMRDNTLAKALCKQGADARLIPTYTPIRTDEEDVSVDQVFFGGINIFLQEKIPLFRWLPKSLDRILDRPGFIRWATKNATSTDAKKLGGLTVSMLKGAAGHQRKEVLRLCEWLTDSFQPDVINFSNALIAGCVPELRKQTNAPIFVTLQGDDIFLEELSDDYRKAAIKEIQRLDQFIDGYITFSNYYAEFMSEYLGIERTKISLTPLGIDVTPFSATDHKTQSRDDDELTIAYMARVAPEKGLHLLVDAFILLHQQHGLTNVKLATAGWMGEHRRSYFDEQLAKLAAAGLSERHTYHGELDRTEKAKFLANADIFSVPTTYREPKGIFVLEAIASGTPVVQPDHGAFPELLSSTRGGLYCEPNHAESLASVMANLARSPEMRDRLASDGHRNIHAKHTDETMASATLKLFSDACNKST
ncbi:MAG: glycosyltransferase family 4 protein, partial [Planctomycetales bacterium]|nr:glycosyltransferase family 4 protein [Planctomycetales bacterium]